MLFPIRWKVQYSSVMKTLTWHHVNDNKQYRAYSATQLDTTPAHLALPYQHCTLTVMLPSLSFLPQISLQYKSAIYLTINCVCYPYKRALTTVK